MQDFRDDSGTLLGRDAQARIAGEGFELSEKIAY